MKNPFKNSYPAPIAVNTPASTAAPAAQEPAPVQASHHRPHAFGSPANHVKPFLGSALQNFTLTAPLLLIAALVLSVLAVRQSAAFVAAYSRETKIAEVGKLSPLIERKPLIAADYVSAASVLAKNNAAVQVALSRNRTALFISIKDPALLPEFIYALVTLQSYRRGVAWSAIALCLNKCDGAAATAEIEGYTQAVSFNELRTK